MSTLWQMYEEAYLRRAQLINAHLLTSRPWITVVLTAIYLLLVTRVLPKFMANRQPFHLKPLMVAYNALQVALCSYIVYRSVTIGWMWNYGLFDLVCRDDMGEKNPSILMEMSTVGNIFYAQKLLDWTETIILLARKKAPTVLVVHVFHHAAIPIMCSFCTVFAPIGQMGMIGTTISLIHIPAYTNLLLAELGHNFTWMHHYKNTRIIRQVIWLMIGLVSGLIALMTEGCSLPPIPTASLILVAVILLVLWRDVQLKAKNSRIKGDQQKKM